MTRLLFALALLLTGCDWAHDRKETTVPYRNQGGMQPFVHSPRTDPTDTDPTHRVRAAHVNANNQRMLRALAIPRLTGADDCADAGSIPAECRLNLPAGCASPGADTVLIGECAAPFRRWVAIPTTVGADLRLAFSDADLLDTGLAGTANYNAIQSELVLRVITEIAAGPLITEPMLHRAATPGSAGHGIYAESFLMRNADPRNLADVVDLIEAAYQEMFAAHKQVTFYCFDCPTVAPAEQVIAIWPLQAIAYARNIRIRNILVREDDAGGPFGSANWTVRLAWALGQIDVAIAGGASVGSWDGDELIDTNLCPLISVRCFNDVPPPGAIPRRFTIITRYQVVP